VATMARLNCGTSLRRSIQKRDFAEWKMGFIDLDKPEVQQVPGCSDFLKEPLTVRRMYDNPSIAYTFLTIFKENIR
jgi:hypothetical protein